MPEATNRATISMTEVHCGWWDSADEGAGGPSRAPQAIGVDPETLRDCSHSRGQQRFK